MKLTWSALVILMATLSGCAMDTTKSDSAKLLLTKSSNPGTYSLYGKGMQQDNESGLMYINVYVGGGGDRDGSLQFATSEIQGYSKTNGFKSFEVVKSDYSFFPLSKYTFYIKYK